MTSPEPIALSRPLRDVCLVAAPTRAELERQRRIAEDAAYARGRRDGEKSLSEQLIQQRAEMVELHQGVVASLRNAIPQLVQETEAALTQLALEAAQRLIAGLPVEPAAIEAIVREALEQIEDHSEIEVQLNSEDLALLRRHSSPLLRPDSNTIRFNGTDDIARGGCVIHTRFGMIDARRETKIQQLRKSLA